MFFYPKAQGTELFTMNIFFIFVFVGFVEAGASTSEVQCDGGSDSICLLQGVGFLEKTISPIAHAESADKGA